MAGIVSPTEGVGRYRWIIAFALQISLFVGFMDRINLTYAIPQITEYYGWAPENAGKYRGILLASFLVAYGLSNAFLSGFAEKLGARKSLMLVVAAFSIFTILGAPLSFSFALFLITRICLGLGEGVHFPMMSLATKHWFPLHERSRANAIWVFGGSLAAILTPAIVVPIVDNFGFRTMLVTTGSMSLLVTLPLVYFLIHNTPRKSPWVRESEAAYIESGLEKDQPDDPGWVFIRTSSFWLAACTGALNNVVVYGTLNWLPTYFVEAKGIDFEDLGWMGPIPYISAFVAFVAFAFLGDATNRRTVLASGGCFLATISVVMAVNTDSPYWALAFFSAGTFFQSGYISQEFALVQRLFPANVVGKATGVYNGIAVAVGGGGGTWLLGNMADWTGSLDTAMYCIPVSSFLAAFTLFALSRRLNY